ncbi:MAG: DUF370 domain-containing protein [Desulfovibrio sp.]|uniref:DUF370 domain-containing protein n=1 Tax=Desulfovibrio sp. 7SRBS1 TaxID=3378064 RepID=UPI003B41C8A4
MQGTSSKSGIAPAEGKPSKSGRKPGLFSIGFGNYLIATRVIAIVNPASSPMRRLREDARKEGRLIDATQGRKTRSIIILDSNHVVLSAIQAETITQRMGIDGETA